MGEVIEESGDLMFAPVRERFRAGAAVTAAGYLRARQRMMRLRAAWNDRVRAFDAVLIPSVPTLPPKTNELLADKERFAAENLAALRNTRIGNLLGLCALTLPTATPSCGVMLMGKPFGEAALCRVGAAAERALAG